MTKDYELPKGRRITADFDENGITKVTVQALDSLIGELNYYADKVCDIEQIRDEIQKVLDAERDFTSENAKAQAIALSWCLEIIDRHTKGEFEQKNKGNKFFSKYLSDYLDRIEKENERLDEILSDEIEKLANK